jgi:hydrogenase 3 maturation protease
MGGPKILPSYPWLTTLNLKFNRLLNPPEKTNLCLAVIGVGQEFCGDDAAGIVIVRRLKELLAGERVPPLLLDAGSAPENLLGSVVRYQPDCILFIDAADMKIKAGSIRLLDECQVDGFGGSTHTLSLGMLARYLTNETGADVSVLAIQPQNLSFNRGISQPVLEAVEEVTEGLLNYWRNADTAVSARISGEVSVVNT